MEICKAPTLRLKALNKHTHIMYIEMENVIPKKERKKEEDIDKGSSITMQKMHTHIHTHTHTHARTHARIFIGHCAAFFIYFIFFNQTNYDYDV